MCRPTSVATATLGLLAWLSAAVTAFKPIGTFPPARLNEVEDMEPEPDFVGDIQNVTVALGREAILSCIVDNLGNYKVGWMRADTQTILTLHKKVVTHNSRISVTHAEPRRWDLHIRMIKVSDRGCYMCQINTATMRKSLGCIDVHVPPNIIDNQTSGDVNVADGESVSLVCAADGYPKPTIEWRREDKEKIVVRTGRKERMKMEVVEGPTLNLTRVNRRQMGVYLCIAKNEVPPAVMKRINVNVEFMPSIQVPNQLVGSPLGSDLDLACRVEAYPRPITFWRKNNEVMILNGPKFKVEERWNNYHTNMSLVIHHLEESDIGTYSCVARNSISQAEGQIRTYKIDLPVTQRPTTDRGPSNGGDSLSTSYDHSAKSSGLHKNRVEDSYTYQAPVDTSLTPYSKGKLKDLHHAYGQQEAGHGRNPTHQQPDLHSGSWRMACLVWFLPLYLALYLHL